MINKWKIATVAALMVAGIASPVFAQSPDHTGSQLPHYYDAAGKQVWGSWGPPTTVSSRHSVARRSGSRSFARVPARASGSYRPQATAGGSIGYNENLRTDQW